MAEPAPKYNLLVSFYLGIDLGTQSIKVVVMDDEGKVRGVGQEELPLLSPVQGAVEQHPDEWWQAFKKALAKAIGTGCFSTSEIRAVGLSGQMHGTVCLDDGGLPVRPAILWADSRSSGEAEELNSRLGLQRLGELTANRIFAGFMCATVLWLKRNEPHTLRRTRTLLLPKDYLRFRLTGRLASDVSDASSTLLFSVSERQWSSEMLREVGIDEELLPTVLESPDVAGELTADTGLPRGIPVVAGGGDQPVSAVSNGVVRGDSILLTIGTGGQVFLPVGEPRYEQALRTHTFCHCLPDTWFIMGAMLSAGLSLRWLRERVLHTSDYDDLESEASQSAPGAGGVIFLPYLLGERTPYMDSGATASFCRLRFESTRPELCRAVMEGVAFALRQCLELVEGIGGQASKIIVSGGGAQSELWRSILASVLNRQLYIATQQEHSARGAGILASVADGLFPSVRQASEALSSHQPCESPHPPLVELYEELYRTFCSLYPRLRSAQLPR